MKNIKELRDALIASYNELRNDEISINKSKELSNIAGKLMQNVKTQLEYDKQVGNARKIDFMEYGS